MPFLVFMCSFLFSLRSPVFLNKRTPTTSSTRTSQSTSTTGTSSSPLWYVVLREVLFWRWFSCSNFVCCCSCFLNHCLSFLFVAFCPRRRYGMLGVCAVH